MGVNEVQEGMLKKIKKDGKDLASQKQPIDLEGMLKYYSSEVLSNDTPESLQIRQKFVEIGLHLVCSGREGWSFLTKDCLKKEQMPKGDST